MAEKSKSNNLLWIILAFVLIIFCCTVAAVVTGVVIYKNADKAEKEEVQIPTAGSTAEVSPAEVSTAEGDTWLVMLYLDADDLILEEDIFFDFNEAELVGSSDKVHIVAQIDRYAGADGYAGGGNWSTTKRYYITQDNDLDNINSTELADLGEVNMGDPETLIDFAVWAANTYPADRHALILSDHGGGWSGGWSDSDPSYDYLTMNELDYAFSQVLFGANLAKLDLVGFDACLMSQLDVFTVTAPYANFAVASEETEPSTGWAYTAFLQKLVNNSAMDGRELAANIVDTYLEQDQRILNDNARARLTQGNTEITAQDLLDYLMPTATLTAVDLTYIPEITAALNEFAQYMTTIDQVHVAGARNYATSFTSPFGKDTVPSFIDLVNFTYILEYEVGEGADNTTGTKLRDAVSKAIVRNKAGSNIAGAQGISIYFPNSVMYTDMYGGYDVYTTINNRFMNDSLWDEFLAYHYANVAFDPESKTVTIPNRMEDVAGPGAGNIHTSDMLLSSDTVSEGEILSFDTQITGNNIGYVYMQYGWLAKDIRTMLVVLGMDYIRADQTREAMGVYYPDWGSSGSIPVHYEFEPRLFFLTDGSESNISFVEVVASKYGQTEDDVQITVPGIFTFANGGRQLYAEMNFNDSGDMTEVLGYTGEIEVIDLESGFEGLFQIDYPGEEGGGDPYPITPSVGDSFMPFFIGYIIEDDVYLNVKSDPITFGAQPFYLAAESAAIFDIDFEYYTAVAVEDLDGNLTDATSVGTFNVK